MPTTCCNCDHLTFCAGKLHRLCEHCEYDYVAKGTPGSAAIPTQSAKSVERDLENKMFQYMDLMGGGSKLLEMLAMCAKEGRRKFLNTIRTFYNDALGMRFTPRHLLYLFMVKSGQNPDGSDGLVVCAFISHKMVPRACAEDDVWEDLWADIPDCRGCFSDLPPDMLKPATNQAFGSKSSFWQQIKNNTHKTPKVIFGRRPLFLATRKSPQQKVGGKSLFAGNACFSISGSKSLKHPLRFSRKAGGLGQEGLSPRRGVA